MSPKDHLFQSIDQFILFSQSEKEAFANHFQPVSFKRKERIVDLEQIASHAFFILEGSMRFYYLDDEGREITGFIFTEGMFASSLESFVNQVPSMQVLECIEPCQCLQISWPDLERSYQEVPRVNILMRKLLQQRLIHAQRVVASLIALKPADRYRRMADLQPHLINRIPQHMLASYLGITPVSLSRIRGRK